jgi:hypothetical protein
MDIGFNNVYFLNKMESLNPLTAEIFYLIFHFK